MPPFYVFIAAALVVGAVIVLVWALFAVLILIVVASTATAVFATYSGAPETLVEPSV